MSEAVKPTPVRFAWLRSIEPNAVLVKDLRQAARNWSVTGAVLLMMAIFFIVSLGFLLLTKWPDAAIISARSFSPPSQA